MVKELSITLNPIPVGGRYIAGSTITGSLTIEVDKPKQYKTIEICLLGKSKVKWSEGSAETRTINSASEVYVNEKLTLWRSEDSPNGTFPVGRHTYPFEFVLPATCPSSYSSVIGNISYEIEGSIYSGLFRCDHKVKQPITVSEVVSVAPSAGVRFERRKTVGCELCVSGAVTFNAQLPTTSFTIGEEIPVSCYVENGSGRQVHLRCSLLEKITYFARGSSHNVTYAITKQSNVAIPPHSETDSTDNIPIPLCRPAITHCNIIKSEFIVTVVVTTPWSITATSPCIDIPVKIGNQSSIQQESRTIS